MKDAAKEADIPVFDVVMAVERYVLGGRLLF